MCVMRIAGVVEIDASQSHQKLRIGMEFTEVVPSVYRAARGHVLAKLRLVAGASIVQVAPLHFEPESVQQRRKMGEVPAGPQRRASQVPAPIGVENGDAAAKNERQSTPCGSRNDLGTNRQCRGEEE